MGDILELSFWPHLYIYYSVPECGCMHSFVH